MERKEYDEKIEEIFKKVSRVVIKRFSVLKHSTFIDLLENHKEDVIKFSFQRIKEREHGYSIDLLLLQCIFPNAIESKGNEDIEIFWEEYGLVL